MALLRKGMFIWIPFETLWRSDKDIVWFNWCIAYFYEEVLINEKTMLV